MSYPSDGRNHHKAIKTEKSMFLCYKEDYEKYHGKKIKCIIHIGGTKTPIDIKIVFEDNTSLTVSIKMKNNIKKGSFDYLNTSPDLDLIPKSNESYKKFQKDKNQKSKQFMIDSFSYDLLNLESKKLTSLVLNKIINKYDGGINSLDIVETSTNKLFIGVTPLFFSVLKNGGYLKIHNNGKKQMSYKIDLFDSENNLQPDTGLRIRLHLNNGWTKWFKGESSTPVIKIQQDNVYKLLQK